MPAPGRKDHRGTHRSGEDRGSSVFQFAVLSGLLITLLMAMFQIGMYFHAQNVARLAARHGLEAARVSTGTDTAGQSSAEEFLAQSAGPLTGSSVTVSRSVDTVTVTVSGDVDTVIPGADTLFDVTVTLSGPIERFEQ